jgi:DNA polymerase
MPAPKSSPGDGDVPLSPNPALDLIATGADLDEAGRVAARCKACELYRDATQVVFGAGSSTSRLMLIGEQPGDEEDLSGEPFVGPAGRLLDDILDELEIDRAEVYVTNAVKHFKWEPGGKRRLHKTPAQLEIEACSQWLSGELEAVRPALVVCLGTTATRALFGPGASLSRWRGSVVERPSSPPVLATVHPSFILRVPPGSRQNAYQGLVDDLKLALNYLEPLKERRRVRRTAL